MGWNELYQTGCDDIAERPAQPSSLAGDLLKTALVGTALAGGAEVLGSLFGSSRSRPSAHDRAVLELATKEMKRGRFVAADPPGFPRPRTTYGRRPDVWSVSTSGYERAIEVETCRSVGTSHAAKQVSAFFRWERRAANRTFVLEVTDES
jgi:hypothetical protein